jgi:hypothetical protein
VRYIPARLTTLHGAERGDAGGQARRLAALLGIADLEAEEGQVEETTRQRAERQVGLARSAAAALHGRERLREKRLAGAV